MPDTVCPLLGCQAAKEGRITRGLSTLCLHTGLGWRRVTAPVSRLVKDGDGLVRDGDGLLPLCQQTGQRWRSVTAPVTRLVRDGDGLLLLSSNWSEMRKGYYPYVTRLVRERWGWVTKPISPDWSGMVTTWMSPNWSEMGMGYYPHITRLVRDGLPPPYHQTGQGRG